MLDATQRSINGQSLLLFGAFLFVTLAIRLGRPIEREALIARAFAEKRAECTDAPDLDHWPRP